MITNSSPYFISYTTKDRSWAKWIAWQLKSAGHEVILDIWDFKKGQNFTLGMHQALLNSWKVIAVLSESYSLNQGYAAAEWTNVYENGKLIVVKIEPIDKSKLGLFAAINHIDLTNLTKKEAKSHLLRHIEPSEDGMSFNPDEEPLFPGEFSDKSSDSPGKDTKVTEISEEIIERYTFKAGLVDKDEQAGHILLSAENNLYINNEIKVSPLAFFMHGEPTQWPKSLLYVLYTAIKGILNPAETFDRLLESEDKTLTGKVFFFKNAEDYLFQLLAQALLPASKNEPPNDGERTIQGRIAYILANYRVPLILYRVLSDKESKDPALICGLLEAWEKFALPEKAPRHILILFYEKQGQPRIDNQLVIEINRLLQMQNKEKSLLKEISSPTKKHVEEWVNYQFAKLSNTGDIKAYIEAEIKALAKQRQLDSPGNKKLLKRIRITASDYEIHHEDLKEILIDALSGKWKKVNNYGSRS